MLRKKDSSIYDLGLSNGFLDVALKAQATKLKYLCLK
jgi:predicted rRNA methylase YqxC with S4 and FtsJ domains